MLALLATSVPAAAAPKPITGTLSKSGYTVIALAANGKATSVRAKRGRFRLVPPARRVTLHLRARNGTYAGPIVVAGNAKRAIVGVMAGAKLGKVNVLKGYAKLSRQLPKMSVDTRRWARARRGVPIGAGRFERVRSQHVRASVPGDRDLDGIPNPLDIDDDGDLILDNIDRSTAGRGARTAQADGISSPITAGVYSSLVRDLGLTANANAGSTPEQIDAAERLQGSHLRIPILPGDSVELDCGDADTGLVYCRKNGSTGRAAAGGPGPPFPGCCDPDNDGFGTLTPSDAQDQFFLTHGATTAQIGTGDVLIQRVTTDGVESQFPATLQYVFATTPALVSYNDGAGNQATVSYPVGPTDPGTGGTYGFPVTDGLEDLDSDVELTLTFWRPQRKAIPFSDPPTATWMDIGGLTYGVISGGPGPQTGCPQSALSTTDPNLTPEPVFGGGGLGDLSADQSANAANTFTYELNLSQCLAVNGVSFGTDDVRMLSFIGARGPDSAQQNVFFKRQ